ncbi:response regulator transcription factor [Anaeromicropila populeti]|uniref:Stage 0 sporulation protein A homolog n=1 Tax=Anaeromicropila populeti TaxID=37658 RepID=A0A1I6HNN4_9FIRM|nr:response regulator transcription factor [Anaeromicropila populeti]SFR56073.1 DNA-binding response regulator, OmpR family, contains REC and winged-helix (wHTH) domain [Anaeromicropila populeti]
MEHILIIEDDNHIAELEKDYLELGGFQVTIENDGTKGVHTALEGRFDVMVLDLMLPEIDGYEILQIIRNKFEIPIIIVSAKGEELDKIRGLGLGADDYIQKPFSPAELTARIKSHLNRYKRLKGKAVCENVLVVKGLEVELTSGKVYVNTKEVPFTKREYEILVFFMSHPNLLISKEELYHAIWKGDIASEYTSLAVYIQKIRKKIEKSPDNPIYIETIWGKGYRFNGC